MIDQEAAALIRKRLISLSAYADELLPFVSTDLESYRGRKGFRRAAERLIQLVAECAIDCAEKVIGACGKPPSPTAREAFADLAKLGVIGDDLATLFARRYVGLRNRIVHDYAEIDDRLVMAGGQGLSRDAARFVKAVTEWLEIATRPACASDEGTDLAR